MSVRNCVKKITAEFNVGLRMCRFVVGLKSNNTASGDLKGTPHMNSLMDGNPQMKKPYFVFPKLDVAIQKNIIEPEKNIKINFELPIRNLTVPELDLPLHIKKEIKEPGKVTSKEAIKMIRIRKRKMRIHKRKKFFKKHRVEILKKKTEKRRNAEAAFQTSLRLILQEKDNYSAEKYVDKTLEKYHWERPVTKVRGRLAPAWVIKQHLEDTEEKRILLERIKKCSE